MIISAGLLPHSMYIPKDNTGDNNHNDDNARENMGVKHPGLCKMNPATPSPPNTGNSNISNQEDCNPTTNHLGISPQTTGLLYATDKHHRPTSHHLSSPVFNFPVNNPLLCLLSSTSPLRHTLCQAAKSEIRSCHQPKFTILFGGAMTCNWEIIIKQYMELCVALLVIRKHNTSSFTHTHDHSILQNWNWPYRCIYVTDWTYRCIFITD